jgi:hypothetical protein
VRTPRAKSIVRKRGNQRAVIPKPPEPTKQGCLPFYAPNTFLLAGLFDILTLPAVRPSFYNFSFIDSFLQFMALPPNEQSRRPGLDGRYYFPRKTINSLLSYIEFGEEKQAFDCAKTTTSLPSKAIYSIFGSDVFHHALTSLISDFLLTTSSSSKRKVIISTLVSVFSIDDTTQRVSISSKVQILALALSRK